MRSFRIEISLRFLLRFVFVSFILLPMVKIKPQQKRPAASGGREKKIVGTLTRTTRSAAGEVTEVEQYVNPPVDFLLLDAEKEPTRVALPSYIQVIEVLREKKGFSFREIAEWLSKRGVEADHNSVYRLYTKKVVGDPEEN